MKKLNLQSETENRIVEVPAEFVDIFMPEATAEELKVYLYLLRAVKDPTILLSVNDMADLFDVTPKKVMAALYSWEEKGVLELKSSDGELTDIRIRDLAGNTSGNSRRQEAVLSETKDDRRAEERIPANITHLPEKTHDTDTDVSRPIDLSVLDTDPEFADLLALAEYYLKKPMNWQMREAVGNSYLMLDRNRDSAEYLLEYCVGQGHMSAAYIQSVARNWESEGLKTVEEIREATAGRNKNVYSIKKALGIRNRELIQDELDYIGSWVKKFDMPIILEACRRTVNQADKPSFRYADAILTAWEKDQVHTIHDIEERDKKHAESGSADRSERTADRPLRTQTAFHNFDERHTDFNALVGKYQES